LIGNPSRHLPYHAISTVVTGPGSSGSAAQDMAGDTAVVVGLGEGRGGLQGALEVGERRRDTPGRSGSSHDGSRLGPWRAEASRPPFVFESRVPASRPIHTGDTQPSRAAHVCLTIAGRSRLRQRTSPQGHHGRVGASSWGSSSRWADHGQGLRATTARTLCSPACLILGPEMGVTKGALGSDQVSDFFLATTLLL
jgi:hypothetical protein